jgi:large subunit ribosomal protein L5
MAPTAQRSRLKSRYEQEIRPALIERFQYTTPMQAPAIRKITLNMGVGDAKQDSKVLEAATEQLATIAGQRPSVRRARKSIAAFKLREGMPVGVSVTLRGERSYEFLDRLMSVAIPRIRDFRGLNRRSFDGRGNYSLGVREQIIFPEIDYDTIDQTRGLDITITTSARTDAEAFALLEAFGFPFARTEPVAAAEPATATPAAAEPETAEDAPAPAEEPETVEAAVEVEEPAAAEAEAPSAEDATADEEPAATTAVTVEAEAPSAEDAPAPAEEPETGEAAATTAVTVEEEAPSAEDATADEDAGADEDAAAQEPAASGEASGDDGEPAGHAAEPDTDEPKDQE